MNAKRGYNLLCKHEYPKAESALKADYSKYHEGGLQNREPVHYTISLLGQGKDKEALAHLTKYVISKRSHPITHHENLLGIVNWYFDDRKAAIEYWLSAFKSHYAADKGYSDVIGMLLFATVHAPRMLPFDEVKKLIYKYRGKLNPDGFAEKIFAYILDEIDERALMGYTILLNLGFDEFNKQASGISVLSDRGRAYYHMALKKYHKTNLREYTNNMRMCVDTPYTHYHIEFLVAYLEVQRLDAEYPVEYFKKR